MAATLTRQDVEGMGLDRWRWISSSLRTRLRTGRYATGLALVQRIGEAAEAADHHPDLDLRYGHLDVVLSSHDAGGVTSRDVALARRIDELAVEAGVDAEPTAVRIVDVVLDTPDLTAIKPFWHALLGYQDRKGRDDEILDPSTATPMVWFQPSGADEPRQRFHLDVRMPADLVEARVAEVVAAGGEVAWEGEGFVALRDPDGNLSCLCRG
jgi:4a-hydroxytetrahydrobiopterin dehydratase